MSGRPVIARCNPPACVRPIRHSGECRPTWRLPKEPCGKLMPRARQLCVRARGHVSSCADRATLDYLRRAQARARKAA